MAAAYCSPAAQAKYTGEFRVPTLFGAQPRSQKVFLAADTQIISDGSSRLHSADVLSLFLRSRGEAGTTIQPVKTQNLTFSLASKSAEPPRSVAAFVV
jgi:hypothetical protein